MRFFALFIGFGLSACAQAGFYRQPSEAEARTLIWENDLTLEQQTEILGLRNEPTTFDLPPAAAEAAWARAHEFIRTHSAMAIVKDTPVLLQTEARVAQSGFVPTTCDAGYRVTREVKGDVVSFDIKTSVCARDWVPCEIGRRRNARMLSRFMRTGALAHPELVQR